MSDTHEARKAAGRRGAMKVQRTRAALRAKRIKQAETSKVARTTEQWAREWDCAVSTARDILKLCDGIEVARDRPPEPDVRMMVEWAKRPISCMRRHRALLAKYEMEGLR